MGADEAPTVGTMIFDQPKGPPSNEETSMRMWVWFAIFDLVAFLLLAVLGILDG